MVTFVDYLEFSGLKRARIRHFSETIEIELIDISTECLNHSESVIFCMSPSMKAYEVSRDHQMVTLQIA